MAQAACAPCLEQAPCSADLECLAPFRSPAFLNALAGRRPLAVESGIMRMTSDFDELGLIWNPACEAPSDTPLDATGPRRAALRALLAEYRGLCPTELSPIPAAVAQTFYQEADWMLPDPLP